MPAKLSKKQQEILDYLKEEILSKGYPPTVREICEKVGLKSTSSVHSHLSTLEKNGYIRRDPTKPRAIEICDDSFQMVRTEMASLPVVGNVAAGQPILAQENIECDNESGQVLIRTDKEDIRLLNRLRLLEQFVPYRIGG